MNAKTRNTLGWIITGLLAAGFLFSGGFKLIGYPKVLEDFARYGISDTKRIVIGAAEILGVIGLFIPSIRRWAILGLIGLMLGAIYIHLTNGETSPSQFGGAAIMIVFLLVLMWLRSPSKDVA